ncbi:MAG TPA: hypothetical protein VMR98_06210 [Candidatus Polarisedimenticolaceae bacterium]|nr:hypothetical protein [Candidatus Polarisedimenticolaceae bacterium]
MTGEDEIEISGESGGFNATESYTRLGAVDGIDGPGQGEAFTKGAFTLQSPQEFRDDFSAAMGRATEQVGLETMQFELCDDTQPIFDGLTSAKQRGVADVRFHYDRVALRHIRAGEDEALVFKGRTVFHKGDKAALRKANTGRELLVGEMEADQIADPAFKKRGSDKRLSHNHVKLAIADGAAWFGTMNLRALDFEMSNFMVKVSDPESVAVLKEVFDQTEAPTLGDDKVFVMNNGESDEEVMFLVDSGVKGQSVIYDKALDMAASLREGDKFVMISQWPPVKAVYGGFSKKLQAKLQEGVRGTFLLSPAQDLHPSGRASRALQEQVDNMQARNPTMTAENLARKTHAKAFLIERVNGEREVLFGSHNLTSWTVRNGTRELAMWTKDPEVVAQISEFLDDVREEKPA